MFLSVPAPIPNLRSRKRLIVLLQIQGNGALRPQVTGSRSHSLFLVELGFEQEAFGLQSLACTILHPASSGHHPHMRWNPRTHRTQAPSPALTVHGIGLCLTPPELLVRGKVRSCSSLPLPCTFSTHKDVATSRPSLNFPELKPLSSPELNLGPVVERETRVRRGLWRAEKSAWGQRETGVGKRVAGDQRRLDLGGGRLRTEARWDAGMGRRGAEGGAGAQRREVWEASLPSGSMRAWSWRTGVSTAGSNVWRGRKLGVGLPEGGGWGQSDQPRHPTRALPQSGAPSCLQDTQTQ